MVITKLVVIVMKLSVQSGTFANDSQLRHRRTKVANDCSRQHWSTAAQPEQSDIVPLTSHFKNN